MSSVLDPFYIFSYVRFRGREEKAHLTKGFGICYNLFIRITFASIFIKHKSIAEIISSNCSIFGNKWFNWPWIAWLNRQLRWIWKSIYNSISYSHEGFQVYLSHCVPLFTKEKYWFFMCYKQTVKKKKFYPWFLFDQLNLICNIFMVSEISVLTYCFSFQCTQYNIAC